MSNFKLPILNFDYNDLLPIISAETLLEHYTKHHRGYCDKLNNTLAQTGSLNINLIKTDIVKLLMNISQYSQLIVNNAGGYFNHNFLWQCIAPARRVEKPSIKLTQLINTHYGSYQNLCESLIQAGMQVFGSGFVWLVLSENNQLKITTTTNQDNPLMDLASVKIKGQPLMAIDVWEHAYYLDYKSNRLQYLQNMFQIMNWSVANSHFENI